MKIFAVAHTWQDVDMSVVIFRTPHKAVKYIGEKVDEGFRKPNVNEAPEEYLEEYNEYIREEQDGMCDNVLALTVEREDES